MDKIKISFLLMLNLPFGYSMQTALVPQQTGALVAASFNIPLINLHTQQVFDVQKDPQRLLTMRCFVREQTCVTQNTKWTTIQEVATQIQRLIQRNELSDAIDLLTKIQICKLDLNAWLLNAPFGNQDMTPEQAATEYQGINLLKATCQKDVLHALLSQLQNDEVSIFLNNLAQNAQPGLFCQVAWAFDKQPSEIRGLVMRENQDTQNGKASFNEYFQNYLFLALSNANSPQAYAQIVLEAFQMCNQNMLGNSQDVWTVLGQQFKSLLQDFSSTHKKLRERYYGENGINFLLRTLQFLEYCHVSFCKGQSLFSNEQFSQNLSRTLKISFDSVQKALSSNDQDQFNKALVSVSSALTRSSLTFINIADLIPEQLSEIIGSTYNNDLMNAWEFLKAMGIATASPYVLALLNHVLQEMQHHTIYGHIQCSVGGNENGINTLHQRVISVLSEFGQNLKVESLQSIVQFVLTDWSVIKEQRAIYRLASNAINNGGNGLSTLPYGTLESEFSQTINFLRSLEGSSLERLYAVYILCEGQGHFYNLPPKILEMINNDITSLLRIRPQVRQKNKAISFILNWVLKTGIQTFITTMISTCMNSKGLRNLNVSPDNINQMNFFGSLSFQYQVAGKDCGESGSYTTNITDFLNKWGRSILQTVYNDLNENNNLITVKFGGGEAMFGKRRDNRTMKVSELFGNTYFDEQYRTNIVLKAISKAMNNPSSQWIQEVPNELKQWFFMGKFWEWLGFVDDKIQQLKNETEISRSYCQGYDPEEQCESFFLQAAF